MFSSLSYSPTTTTPQLKRYCTLETCFFFVCCKQNYLTVLYTVHINTGVNIDIDTKFNFKNRHFMG